MPDAMEPGGLARRASLLGPDSIASGNGHWIPGWLFGYLPRAMWVPTSRQYTLQTQVHQIAGGGNSKPEDTVVHTVSH